jgi:hypothetical protein
LEDSWRHVIQIQLSCWMCDEKDLTEVIGRGRGMKGRSEIMKLRFPADRRPIRNSCAPCHAEIAGAGADRHRGRLHLHGSGSDGRRQRLPHQGVEHAPKPGCRRLRDALRLGHRSFAYRRPGSQRAFAITCSCSATDRRSIDCFGAAEQLAALIAQAPPDVPIACRTRWRASSASSSVPRPRSCRAKRQASGQVELQADRPVHLFHVCCAQPAHIADQSLAAGGGQLIGHRLASFPA